MKDRFDPLRESNWDDDYPNYPRKDYQPPVERPNYPKYPEEDEYSKRKKKETIEDLLY